MNRMVMSMVSVLRLTQRLPEFVKKFSHAKTQRRKACRAPCCSYGVFVSAAGFFCGSVIASTLLFSTNETRPLRLNQMPCASSHAASASTVEPSFILMMARSPVAATSLVPVAIGPLLSAAGGGVAAGAAGLGLATGLSVSPGLGLSLGCTWLFAGTSATWLGATGLVSFGSLL